MYVEELQGQIFEFCEKLIILRQGCSQPVYLWSSNYFIK
jgi:hypothetical protein